MKQVQSTVRRFAGGESGAGTAFSLYMLIVVLGLLGIMLDSTQGWWNKTRLSAAADIGAHAGAVGIANDMPEAQLKAEVVSIVEENLPRTIFGQVIDGSVDVALVHYDTTKNEFDNANDPNTVIVRLQRTRSRGNDIRTFLLKFANVPSFETTVFSAAVFDINGKCTSSDGIYAQSTVTLTSQTDIGAGFCVHSNDKVWLPQQNTFQPGAYVSMPKLALCEDKCDDSQNPGIVAIESYMHIPDIAAWIQDTYDAFVYSGLVGQAEIVTEFFDGLIVGDQTELIDKNILTAAVPLGTVVPMSQAQFNSVQKLPSGLIYHVTCTSGGSGTKTWLNFSATTAQMNDAALMTNCNINFADGARAVGSVIVTTRESSNATVTAGSSVTVADPSKACNEDERTILMSKSKVSVPAEFTISNLTLVVDDDVDVASATSSGIVSKGLSIYSSQRVKFSAQHTFRTCGTPDAFLTPTAKVLRLVMPPQMTNVASAI
ncbi:TadE/TadG family type IV pilus assembly protein [Tropicimonas sediminicola]|uniref:DUF7867 domain-containing protein n=1 Tax=Tropicimonas sediminicola TaxID=1031541 RepID=A0A239EUB8_9RHOB|nr:Tad domain-containing protein [Tropicimonas sediminicola]SNS48246.1 hypothetical protein SAMN05421757_102338 [Tropicimonas sediminicola]